MTRPSKREIESELSDMTTDTDTNTLDEFWRPGTPDSVVIPTDAEIEALTALDRDPTQAEIDAVLGADDPHEVLSRPGVDG